MMLLSLEFYSVSSIDILYFYLLKYKVCQVLTYFISIGQNLHRLVNQRTLGVLTDTLINNLTLRVSNDT